MGLAFEGSPSRFHLVARLPEDEELTWLAAGPWIKAGWAVRDNIKAGEPAGTRGFYTSFSPMAVRMKLATPTYPETVKTGFGYQVTFIGHEWTAAPDPLGIELAMGVGARGAVFQDLAPEEDQDTTGLRYRPWAPRPELELAFGLTF